MAHERQMSDEDGQQKGRVRRFLRRPYGLLSSFFLILLLIGGAIWLARIDIAEGMVDRALRQNDVEARYEIQDIGFRTQKIRNLIIGDPDRPDLTADEIDVGFDLLGSGTDIVSLRAKGVRLYGRFVDGKLRLGELDKLRNLDSNAPFELPNFFAELEDVRMRLETPVGAFGLSLAGRGRLDNAFKGRLGIIGRDLAYQNCAAGQLSYVGRVTTSTRGAAIDGQATGKSLDCPDQQVALGDFGGAVKAQLDPEFQNASGQFDLAGNALGSRWVSAPRLAMAGEVDFAGATESTKSARIDLELTPELRSARLDNGISRDVASQFAIADGSPVEAVSDRLRTAFVNAARDFDLDSAIRLSLDGGQMAATVEDIRLLSESGTLFRSARAFDLAQKQDRWHVNGDILVNLLGGGFPNSSLALSGNSGNGFSGRLEMDEIRAGKAMLAIPELRFSPRGQGRTRLVGSLRMSGPLAGGQLSDLSVPIVAAVTRNGVMAQPGCFNMSIDGWRSETFSLGANKVRLCGPANGWMVQSGEGGLRIAARASAQRLSGSYGQKPASLGWGRLDISSADGVPEVRASGVQIILGAHPNNQQVAIASAEYRQKAFSATEVRYSSQSSSGTSGARIASLSGKLDANGSASGIATGIEGSLAAIPLALSETGGEFAYDEGVLTLNGDARIAYDGGTEVLGNEPVFQPVRLSSFTLRFADNVLMVNGPMLLEETGDKIAALDLVHNMSSGQGRARFIVDNLRFYEQLQPHQLFPATYGTVSAVKGGVSGEGLIEWNDAGVASSGTFTVAETDLAAAFGPVKGLAGKIHFTDLLGLETAPGQVFTVRSVNPGIEVLDGLVRFQLLSGLRTRVEGGEWPFAGGKLVLRPTIIDLSSQEPRYLSFYIKGLDAAQFVQDMEYEDVNATGIFDGELPMVFDQDGGRIDNGTLLSRSGGGSLAYVGELSYEDMGTFANYAFDILKSVAYDRLEVVMNGEVDGEIVTQIEFSGLQQGEGAARNFITRQIAKLPIQFNINITAPFMQLLGTVRGLNDPKLMVGRNLEALLAEQRRERAESAKNSDRDTVQRSESEPVVEGKVEK